MCDPGALESPQKPKKIEDSSRNPTPHKETPMSDSDSPFANFGKLVPGFDFLQNLTKQATDSAAKSLPQMPQLASWVAPTVSVEELEKRIQELKAVQFWLDQNATALKATIQALEVQKMTLATLKSMNVAMGDVANAFSFKPADAKVSAQSTQPTHAPHTFTGLEVPPPRFGSGTASAAPAPAPAKPEPAAEAAAAPKAEPATSVAGNPGVIDPMQWWGALTQQFQTIAADAMKDVAKKAAINTSHVSNASRKPAAGPLQGAMKSATDAATELAKNMQAGMTKAMTAPFEASPAPRSRGTGTALRTGSAWPTPVAGKKSPAAKAGKATGKQAAKTPAKTVARKAATTKASGAERK